MLLGIKMLLFQSNVQVLPLNQSYNSEFTIFKFQMTKNIKSFPHFDSSYDRKYNKRFKSKNNFWLCRK